MSEHPEANDRESAGGAPGEMTGAEAGAPGEVPVPTVAPTAASESGTPEPGASEPGAPEPGAPEPGAPEPGTPPWGTPPNVPPNVPPWATPPWGGPPQWYGWGPGWSGSAPPGLPGPPGAPPGPPAPRRPLPWVIVGSVIAAIAMVALGLGIGYSVWGTSAPAVSRNGAAAPAPPIEPPLGRGAFLGVVVVSPGGLGGTSAPSTAAVPGAHVVAVVPSSPAAKAGIVKGDVITELATRPVRSAVALRTDVLRLAPGERVEVGWTTPSGAHESARVTLARRPTTGSVG